MRLNYKILWCEDDLEWLEEAQDHIEEYLKDLGFVAVIENVRSEDEQDLKHKLNISQDYDLILMDYKFNDKPIGQMYINLIRSHNIFAEVVFYSGVRPKELYDQIARLSLDGVYVSPRVDGFYDKVKKVIQTTVKKVLDVNAMRGIVMAATSETDKKFFEIIKVVHDTKLNDEQKGSLRDKILKRIKKRFDDLQRKHAEVNPSDPWEYLSSTINFGADLRFITLKKEILENTLGANKASSAFHDIYNTIGKYEEINRIRNLLAHEQERKETHGDKTTIHVHNISFDEAFALDLRSKLVEQEEKVSDLFHRVSQA